MKNRNGWNRKDGTEGLTKKKKKVCIPAEAGVFFCHFFGQPQRFASRIASTREFAIASRIASTWESMAASRIASPREFMAASRIASPQLFMGLRTAAGVLTA